MRRFEVLDSFRGLAALIVFFHHLHVSNTFTQFDFFKNGFIFVEFFFVLSGFVITLSYFRSPKNIFTNFAMKRFKRIFPVHIIMLIVFVLMEILKYVANKYGYNFNHEPFTGRWDVFEIIPNLLLVHAWFPNFNASSFNSVSWSISIEFYVYILFFIIAKFSGKYLKLISVLIVLICFIANLNNLSLLLAPIERGIYCFFIGSIGYFIFCKVQHISVSKNAFNIIEIILLAFLIFIVSSNYLFEKQLDKLVYPIFFLIFILVFSFEKGFISDFLKCNPFILLGELSYSLYMTHVFVISIFIAFIMVSEKLLGSSFTYTLEGVRYLTLNSVFFNNLLIVIVFLICLATAKICNVYVEKKFMHRSI